MVLHYLKSSPDARLFGLEFVVRGARRYSVTHPKENGDVIDAILDVLGQPSAFLIAEGDTLWACGPALLAFFEVCDGDA